MVEQHCRHYKIVFLPIKEEILVVVPVKATKRVSERILCDLYPTAVLLLSMADVQISSGIVAIIRNNGTGYSSKRAAFLLRTLFKISPRFLLSHSLIVSRLFHRSLLFLLNLIFERCRN